MRRASRRSTQIGAAFGILVGAIYHAWLFLAALRWNGNDFGKFYFATRYWLDGKSMYATSPATELGGVAELAGRQFLDMNPPHFHLVVLPFLAWSLRRAAIIWLIANIYTAGLAAALIVRELEIDVRKEHVLPLLFAILACSATAAVTVTGQFTALLLLPMVLAWRAARAERWARAGAWLGLLISVKPFFGLFLPLLLTRRRSWPAVVSAAAAIAGAFGVGVAVFGWRTHREWLDALGAVDWTWAAMNASVYGTLARALAPSPSYAMVANAPGLIRVVWIVASAGIALGTWLAWTRSTDHGFAATILAAVLISPLGWIYYGWLVVGPCAALWRRTRPRIVWFGLAALAVPLPLVTAFQPSAIATITWGSAYTWGILSLWLGVLASSPADPL